MSSPQFKDHFSSGSENYAAYRPTYPVQLIHELASITPGAYARAAQRVRHRPALSIAGRTLREGVATDASYAQIENAQPREGVHIKWHSLNTAAFPIRARI